MKYTATIHSQLTGKRLCKVEFDNDDAPLQPLWFLAQCAASVKGIRNVQYTDVKNIKEVTS